MSFELLANKDTGAEHLHDFPFILNRRNIMNAYINTITDYDIQALIDDELEHERAKQVMLHVEQNRRAQERYIELKEQKDLLKQWWGKIRQ